jgi:hypothetical protein
MKRIRLLRNLTLSAVFAVSSGILVFAQEAILVAGGNATGNGGSASYSIGQVFYNLHALASGSIAEGVQQPYEVYVISGTEETDMISLECRVYPNPVSVLLLLQTGNTENLPLFYRLVDSNGRVLLDKRITVEECAIPMVRYAAGVFYLVVRTRDKNLRTFKIIKH